MRESIEQVGANHDTAPVNSGTRQLVLAGIVLRPPRYEREPDTVRITVSASLAGMESERRNQRRSWYEYCRGYAEPVATVTDEAEFTIYTNERLASAEN